MGSARADAEGRFELPLPDDRRASWGAPYVVHATLDGFGEGVRLLDGPRESLSATEHTVEVHAGGVVRGTLQLPNASSPAGWSVYAKDGAGGERRVFLDEGGAFRFDGLRPGRWHFKPSPPERSSGSWKPEAAVVPVEASRSSEVRLTAERAGAVRLEVRLDLGVPPGPWQMKVSVDDAQLHGTAGSRSLDTHGRAALDLFEPGEAALSIGSKTGPFLGWMIRDRRRLSPGTNVVHVEQAVAELRVRVPDGLAETGRIFLRTADGDRTAGVNLTDRGRGDLGLVPVPAGRLRVVHVIGFRSKDRTERELAVLDLRPGEVAELALEDG